MTLKNDAQPIPPSINYHLWQPCNMRCRFCFATFLDSKAIVPKGHLNKDDALLLTRLLTQHCNKLTFAGGEPTLCPWLVELIQAAKDEGCTTMLVTNGSKLTPQLLERLEGRLDWITLSIDSLNEDNMRAMGRAIAGKKTISEQAYRNLVQELQKRNFQMKLNTVVTSINQKESMADFVRFMNPERWKIFQVLPIEGQNFNLPGQVERHSGGTMKELLITSEQFEDYVFRHNHLKEWGINVVPEDNEAMTGSYAMVDPAGRFYDNDEGSLRYSKPILEIGLKNAWKEVMFHENRFLERGGLYDWEK
jgi:radical S-adenosyl methionine domain-containing protein 2